MCAQESVQAGDLPEVFTEHFPFPEVFQKYQVTCYCQCGLMFV